MSQLPIESRHASPPPAPAAGAGALPRLLRLGLLARCGLLPGAAAGGVLGFVAMISVELVPPAAVAVMLFFAGLGVLAGPLLAVAASLERRVRSSTPTIFGVTGLGAMSGAALGPALFHALLADPVGRSVVTHGSSLASHRLYGQVRWCLGHAPTIPVLLGLTVGALAGLTAGVGLALARSLRTSRGISTLAAGVVAGTMMFLFVESRILEGLGGILDMLYHGHGDTFIQQTLEALLDHFGSLLIAAAAALPAMAGMLTLANADEVARSLALEARPAQPALPIRDCAGAAPGDGDPGRSALPGTPSRGDGHGGGAA